MSKLTLQQIKQDLSKAPDMQTAVSYRWVQEKFVENYQNATGRKDGDRRYQQEVFYMKEAARQNPKILETEKFSWYAALINIAASGLSLRDGQVYLIPYKSTLKAHIGNLGKRERLYRMKSIKEVTEGQVIRENDIFEYDYLNQKINKHLSTEKSGKKIIGAYCRIIYKDDSIKDVYMDETALDGARAKSKKPEQWDGLYRAEMCKKSTYGRAYKLYFRDEENEVPYEEYVMDADYEDVTPVQQDKKPGDTKPKSQHKPRPDEKTTEWVQGGEPQKQDLTQGQVVGEPIKEEKIEATKF